VYVRGLSLQTNEQSLRYADDDRGPSFHTHPVDDSCLLCSFASISFPLFICLSSPSPSLSVFLCSEYFAAHGTVLSASVIRDSSSGLSKGYGFVTLADVSEALRVRQTLHHTDLDGAKISVFECKPGGREANNNSSSNRDRSPPRRMPFY
jgi:RNA recognition motif-containing protein